MLTIAEREAQQEFLNARARYHAAHNDFKQGQIAAWQVQIVRDQYVAAIAHFALVCGALTNWDFSSLESDTKL